MSEDYARLGLTGDSIELKVWDEMTEKEKAEAAIEKAEPKDAESED